MYDQIVDAKLGYLLHNNPDEIISENKKLNEIVKHNLKITERLIKHYESIIHGTNTHIGLMQCYDTYYAGVWDKRLRKIKRLKTKLK